MNLAIPILSLVIAALAVIVGPFVSWRVANRQIIAPMRQAWINELRKNLARLLGSASFYLAAGVDTGDAKEYKQLVEIQQEIELTINPREEQHKELVDRIAVMMKAMVTRDKERFIEIQRDVVKRAQSILKTEWNRVK
jgi:hypothetical protein